MKRLEVCSRTTFTSGSQARSWHFPLHRKSLKMESSSSVDHLPPLKGGRLEDSSLDRSTLKSSQTMKKKADTNKKLGEITEKLNAIRLQRNALKKYDDGRVYGPKTDYSTVPKKLFSHPHLEYVYGEIMFSPYLTNPRDSYPKAVYTMADKLKTLKAKGVQFKDLPESEKPYDDSQLKRAFIREVCNYNPKFNVPKMKKGDSGSLATGSFTRASTANSSMLGRATTATSASSTTPKGQRAAASPSSPSTATSVKRSSSPLGRNAGSSRSSRSKKLDGLKPRRHASSSSMSKSLDASSFSLNNSQSFDLSSVAKSAPTASMRYEKDTFDPEEDEYKDDFADPPAVEEKDITPLEVQEEDNYEQDFEVTVIIVPEAAAPNTEQDGVNDAYNEDFELEIVESERISPSSLKKTNIPVKSGYVDDFNVPEEEGNETAVVVSEGLAISKGVSGTVSSSIDESECVRNETPPVAIPVSVASTVSNVALHNTAEGNNDAYMDDFDEQPGEEAPAPLVSLSADTHDNNISSKLNHIYTCDSDASTTTAASAVLSAKVDPNSVKLRTDLIPAVSNKSNTSSISNPNSNDGNVPTTAPSDGTVPTHLPLHHENTGQSVLSDASNSSIPEECDHAHTVSPPVPSTVRSEISVSNGLVGSSQQNSYSHSINSFHQEMDEHLTKNNETSVDTDVNMEGNAPKDEYTADAGGEEGVLHKGIAAVGMDTIDDNFETVEDTVENALDNSTVETIVDSVITPAELETVTFNTADTAILDTFSDAVNDTQPDPLCEDLTPVPSTHLRDSPLEFPASERLDDSPYSPIPTEHIDLIAYTEHKNSSAKENVTVENNFLHSPVKSHMVESGGEYEDVYKSQVENGELPDKEHCSIESEVDSDELHSPVGTVMAEEVVEN